MSYTTIDQFLPQIPNKGDKPRTAPPTNELDDAPNVKPKKYRVNIGGTTIPQREYDVLAQSTFLNLINIDQGVPMNYTDVVPKSGYRYNYFEPYLQRYSKEDRTPTDHEISQLYPFRDNKFHYTRTDPRIEEQITRRAAIHEASQRVGDMIDIVENIILPENDPNLNIDAQGDNNKQLEITKLKNEVAQMRNAKVPEEYIAEHVKKALSNIYMTNVDKSQQAIPTDEYGKQINNSDGQIVLNPMASAGANILSRPQQRLTGVEMYKRSLTIAGSSSEQKLNARGDNVLDPNGMYGSSLPLILEVKQRMEERMNKLISKTKGITEKAGRTVANITGQMLEEEKDEEEQKRHDSVFCFTCRKRYVNIAAHRKTLKHKENERKGNVRKGNVRKNKK